MVKALVSVMVLMALSQAQAQVPKPGPLKIHALTTTLYWVEGGIGNAGFIIGDSGVVVVDTTISPDSGKELLADIARITPKPVTAVILTHGDIDHVGGLSAFPSGIQVIAQENTQKAMRAAVAAGRSHLPSDHLPGHSVDKREAVTLGGVKLELLHWAPAHTDGDLVVYLPAQKIVFTGDLFALDQPRALIHLEQHGSSAGWITSTQGILALNADQFVVGHGDVQDKKSLQARVNLVSAERRRIQELVAQGKSLEQIEAAVGDPPPGQIDRPGYPRFTPFSEAVYRELTEKK
jgi:glyoxylase-like metal-dependent hydrolase (beta-lactamase superfamily II)